MGQLIRFGRRVPLPSTVQIVHDLLVAQRDENVHRLDAAQTGDAQGGAMKDGVAKADAEMAPKAAANSDGAKIEWLSFPPVADKPTP